jgi:hypothetical protein
MPNNPILEELYAVRRQIMNEHGDDLVAYLHSEFERLKASGHPIANIKQRTIQCTGAAKSGELVTQSQSSPLGDR